MKNVFVILLFFVSIKVFSQDSKLSMFGNLVEKTWRAEGNWGDGSKFVQEIKFEYSLDSTLVITNAIGFVDKEQTKLGKRNHGIRQFDKESNSIKFWEFDVFGGLTEGVVFSKDKNIIYQYEYGGSNVTDMWEYVNDSTYNFKVGNHKDGVWKQLYLSTQFIEVK
ncbi:hypothetical protein D1816_11170 [Aquimarina sp. AD10]|uniref:hypothetical protein n=1 Tax=Aquimarina sp. AD10 TaxID=1714849 RepID=UPI000E46762B|nr:hypothetical protein [Aquimarina sp. AD10]AXT60882.1 hypothetical protein D1816_11170 [Aquimarina sp. AD10]RKM93041.1 hypothetical protein D7033_20275 [Aquimarina sp. AD10]